MTPIRSIKGTDVRCKMLDGMMIMMSELTDGGLTWIKGVGTDRLSAKITFDSKMSHKEVLRHIQELDIWTRHQPLVLLIRTFAK